MRQNNARILKIYSIRKLNVDGTRKGIGVSMSENIVARIQVYSESALYSVIKRKKDMYVLF